MAPCGRQAWQAADGAVNRHGDARPDIKAIMQAVAAMARTATRRATIALAIKSS